MSAKPQPNDVPRPGQGSSLVPNAPSQVRTVLEKDVPVSQSLIWRRQRDAYADRGLKSWTEDSIPQFITNNPFIAEMYARMVSSFLSDYLKDGRNRFPASSKENPLRILELGAGPGKFAFLFLRHLEALLPRRGIAPESIRYVMTDGSPSLVDLWRANPHLSEFAVRGILEFRSLDLNGEITAECLFSPSDQNHAPSAMPLIVIANYVFDSLPYDAFAIEQGELCRWLQTASAPEETGSESGVPISKLDLSFRKVEIKSAGYHEPHWNSAIEEYRRRLPSATVLFPTRALEILQAIRKFTNGPFLVLAADKGYSDENDFSPSHVPPALDFHSANCFSQMVNFDALAKVFDEGDVLLPEKHAASLKVCAFLDARGVSPFSSLKTCYRELQSQFGLDDLFALFAWLNPYMDRMSILQILAVLRLSRWDPTTLIRLYPVLTAQIRSVAAERQDLRDAIARTWANHFPIRPQDNLLAFYCGVLLLGLGFFQDAQLMFEKTRALMGDSAATSYNLGLCREGLGDNTGALALFSAACDQDPSFEPAQLARRKLQSPRENRDQP